MRLGVKAIIDILFKKIFGSRDHPKTTLALLNAILEAIGRPGAGRGLPDRDGGPGPLEALEGRSRRRYL